MKLKTISDAKNVAEANKLDSWVAFYYKHGRYPGNSELTILPQSQIPKLIDPLSVEVSPIEVYNKFGSSDAKALVSFKRLLLYFYILAEKDFWQKER